MNTLLQLAQLGKGAKHPVAKIFTARRFSHKFLDHTPQATVASESPSTNFPPKSPTEHQEKIIETRKFLDRAILLAAKERLATPAHEGVSIPKPAILTPEKWVWQLAASYYLTHSTPSLMQIAAQQFAAIKRENLAQWATEKAAEEQGHDQLALLDIQAMGYDAQAVVETLKPPGAIALLDFFTQSANASDPIECVGYSYTLERLATIIDASHIQQVEAALPSGIHATRCLRMHSSLGGDVHHVEETLEVIADLTSEEQRSIQNACYKTACLYFDSLQANPASEADLQKALSCLRVKICS